MGTRCAKWVQMWGPSVEAPGWDACVHVHVQARARARGRKTKGEARAGGRTRAAARPAPAAGFGVRVTRRCAHWLAFAGCTSLRVHTRVWEAKRRQRPPWAFVSSSRRPSASAQRPAAQPRGAGRPTLACTRASATSPCPAPRRATGFFRCGLPGRPPAAASPSPGVGRRRMGWAGRCGWRAGWRREASSSLPEASPAPLGAEPHFSGLPLWWGQCHQGFPRGMRFGGAF